MAEEKIYRSLTDLERRRRKLKSEILSRERVMTSLWRSIVHKKPHHKPLLGRGQRLTGLLTTGVSIIDGAVLAWRLYRKFRR